MKKSLFSLVAVAGMLFATSCSSDIATDIATGDEAVVRFTVGVENVAHSRAISDGEGANTLVYQIYSADGTVMDAFTRQQDDDVTFPYTLELRLVKGQSYRIAFWAQNSDCSAYDTGDLTNVTVDYDGLNNDESRDAFFNVESFTVTGDQTISSTLRRPFAQVNVGVDKEDYAAAQAAGIEIATSKAVISKVPNTLNLLTGEVSGETVVTYDFAKVPAGFDTPEALKVKLADKESGEVTETEFEYMSMSYILAAAEKATVDEMVFTFHPESGADIVLSQGLTNVPVQRNWRTNILGAFFTSKISLTIVIDPSYYGDYNFENDTWTATLPDGVEYDAATNTVTISTVDALKWLSDATNGVYEQGLYKDLDPDNKKANDYAFKKYVLKENAEFDLSAYNPWKPIKMVGSDEFDGQNATIKNLTVRSAGSEGAAFINGFTSTVRNITIENVDIEGNYCAAGVISAQYASAYNCHVNGGTITSTPWDPKSNGVYDDANNVGGIVAFWGGDAYGHTIDGCSAKNLTIKAFRKVGGIIGYDAVTSGNLNTVKNCTVENVKIIADMLETRYDSYDTRKPEAGKIVGNEETGSTQELQSNTSDDNTTVEVWSTKVSDVAGMKAIAEAVKSGNSFKGATITLTEDLNLEGEEWTPIGSTSAAFEGNFDGGGHTISDITISTGNYVGLFGNTNGASISNVKIHNANVKGRLGVAVIAGHPYVTNISDIEITGKVTVEGSFYVGTVGGGNMCYGNYSNITVNVEEGSYVKADSREDGKTYATYVGGVIGHPGEGRYTYENITSNIDVIGSSCYVGGIIGLAHYGSTFKNCKSSGNVSITDAEDKADGATVGGIAGCWNAGGANVTFDTDCEFTGTLSSNMLSAEELANNNIVGNVWGNGGSGRLFFGESDVTDEHSVKY